MQTRAFRRALVLGATGMIGTHAVRACLQEQIPVRALVRSNSSRSNLDGSAVEIATGDLDDRASLAAALAGCDLLIHAAAAYPHRYFGKRAFLEQARRQMGNALATLSEAARKTPVRMVYVSSVTTIGRATARTEPPSSPLLARESDRAARVPRNSPYFEVKHLMESLAEKAAAAGADLVVVNPTFCIDACDSHRTTAQLLVPLAKGQIPARIPGWLNALPTTDVGAGIMRAAHHGRSGERYILGGENLTSGELLERCARAAGVRAPRFSLPIAIALAASYVSELFAWLTHTRPLFPMAGVQMLQYGQPVDISRAQNELGFQPTSLDDAIARAYAWYREQGDL